ILKAHQLAPHRIWTFKLSNDSAFAEKLKDIVGLYVDPPEHDVVLSVDERSQIQGAQLHPAEPRSEHAAPAAPGAHPLPQHCRSPSPRHERQSMPSSTTTQPTSIRRCNAGWRVTPVDLPLHADLRVPAERRRVESETP